MYINFDKIELDNLINLVTGVEKSEIEHGFLQFNIYAATVVCGDNEVNNVSFNIHYDNDINDKIIHMTAKNGTWKIVWENNDISIDDLKKLFTEKIVVIDKDKDRRSFAENLHEIIELNTMYNKIRKAVVSYSDYIEYVKKYINR